MCEAVGHRVMALERVAFGPLQLGALEPGQARRLGADEVDRLHAAAGWKPSRVVRLRALRGATTVTANAAEADPRGHRGAACAR